MTTTVFVKGAGGTIFEMDIPTDVHALERYQLQLAKGELQAVDPDTVEKVELGPGWYQWRSIVTDEPEPEPADDSDDDDDDDAERTALLAEADSLGIKASRRWGIPKLIAAIEAAKNGG